MQFIGYGMSLIGLKDWYFQNLIETTGSVNFIRPHPFRITRHGPVDRTEHVCNKTIIKRLTCTIIISVGSNKQEKDKNTTELLSDVSYSWPIILLLNVFSVFYYWEYWQVGGIINFFLS